MVILVQRNVWLDRPILEWQSRAHWAQLNSHAGLSDCLASDCWTRVSSNLEAAFCTVFFQADRSEATRFPGVAQLGSACGTISLYQFSVAEILGNPATVHSH